MFVLLILLGGSLPYARLGPFLGDGGLAVASPWIPPEV